MAHAHDQERGVHALLSDGTTILVRPVLPSDREGLLRLYDDMSGESRRRRFFGTSRDAGRHAANHALASGRSGHGALVAVHGERIVGIAEYEVTGAPGVAEISPAVVDDFQRRGVSTLLVEHLADAARTSGVTAFSADTLASNPLMQRLVADLGLAAERRTSTVKCG